MAESIVVVRYEHKGGTDLSLYSRKEQALQAAAMCLVENIYDVHDAHTRSVILWDIMTFNYEDAIAVWTEWQREAALDVESLTIEELPVDKDVPDARAVRDKAKQLREGGHASPKN